MIISFAWTAEQVVAGLKDVTRRDWSARTIAQYAVGTEHEGWNKLPYATGAKPICMIRVKSLRPEPLLFLQDPKNRVYALDEIRREGGMWATPQDFVDYVTDNGKRVFKYGIVRLEFELIKKL